MAEYAESLRKLIEEFKKLPGIGPKSAQRLAFHILEVSAEEVKKLAASMLEAKKTIRHCSVCFNLTDKDPCEICADKSRETKVITVVEEPKDLIAIERTGFRGLYHVLGGAISPLDGLGPENLRIKELLKRITSKVSEVVLALNPSTEGEATAIYLHKLLQPLGVKITRIAYGLPVGADMDYADPMTLTRALEGRREVNV
ncbi:recombination protein RecR [Candidatus Saganbacteria bacterium]|nr:recombination protein RecR [Candidatus Saganbacteria bacterium]